MYDVKGDEQQRTTTAHTKWCTKVTTTTIRLDVDERRRATTTTTTCDDKDEDDDARRASVAVMHAGLYICYMFHSRHMRHVRHIREEGWSISPLCNRTRTNAERTLVSINVTAVRIDQEPQQS